MKTEAHLYMGGICQKVIFCNHRPNNIRIANMNLAPRRFNVLQEEFNPSVVPIKSVFVYEIVSQIGPYAYQYDFSHVETDHPSTWVDDSLDLGFMEPTADVNLDKLTMKLRNNKEMKEQLKRYYRR